MIAAAVGTALAEATVKVGLAALVKELQAKLSNSDGVERVDTGEVRQVLQQHLQLIERWSGEISFRDLRSAKSLDRTFVDLDLTLGPIDASDRDETLSVSSLESLPGHAILLGDPGAGKTTSIKKLARRTLETSVERGDGRFPVLVLLRELGATSTLAESVFRAFGISVRLKSGLTPKQRRDARFRLAAKLLATGCSNLLLDGLDEIHPKARDYVITELRQLALELGTVKIVVSCRAGDFSYQIDRMQVYSLLPLSEGQTRQFAIKWLGARKAANFLEDIKKNPYSGTEVRPLTLAHLCAIYERSGSVPDKPRSVYRKIVRLLLEEWDEQRSVRRYSKYANFEIDRKQDFLEAIAFQLARAKKSPSFRDADLRLAYIAVHADYGLPVNDAARVVSEIESHTGLIVQISDQKYEFAHKSLQEFLAASYMLRLPRIPRAELFSLPNETALAIALSAAPTEYMEAALAVMERSSYVKLGYFTEPFLQRLHLERVDWISSEKLGRTFLRLYSATYAPGLGDGRMPSEVGPHPVVQSFVEIPAIASSINAVLRECGIVAATEEIAIATTGGRIADFEQFAVSRAIAQAAVRAGPLPRLSRWLEATKPGS